MLVFLDYNGVFCGRAVRQLEDRTEVFRGHLSHLAISEEHRKQMRGKSLQNYLNHMGKVEDWPEDRVKEEELKIDEKGQEMMTKIFDRLGIKD